MTVYVAGLTAAALWQDPVRLNALMAEGGPVESASWFLWLVLAAACLAQFRWRGWQAIVFSVAALFFAAREADFHVAFTQAGIFKISYYTEVAAPTAEKLVAGAVSLLLLGSILLILAGGLRTAVAGGWRWQHTRTAAFAAVLLVGCKVLDRFPAQYRQLTGDTLPSWAHDLVWSYEEGLEMILPVLFLVAVSQWRKFHSALRHDPLR